MMEEENLSLKKEVKDSRNKGWNMDSQRMRMLEEENNELRNRLNGYESMMSYRDGSGFYVEELERNNEKLMK